MFSGSNVFADLSLAASTGPAFEAHLLASSGPAVVLNLGGTSCLACETPRSAAETQRVNLSWRGRGLTWQTFVSQRDVCWIYRLLLTEQEAAKLRVGSRVREAKYGALRLGLTALSHLVGRSYADRRLLIGWSCRSHRHLKTCRTV